MTPPLRVVIATHGRHTRLKQTLASLAACELPDCYAGLTVVENGGAFGAEDAVHNAPTRLRASYRYLEDANKDLALNAALERMDDATLVFFADDDVRLDPDLLMRYAAAATGCTGGTFYGGPTGVDYESQPPGWLISHLPPSARGWSPDPSTVHPATVHFLGYNWAAFAGDLKRAGLFNPMLGGALTGGPMRDEFDMQDRLRRMGVVAQFVPDAMVWHYIPADRCTPEWLAQRRYRNGLVEGLSPHGKSTLRIMAGTVYRALVALSQVASGYFRGGPSGKFAARCTLAYALGVIRGRWMRITGMPD